MRPVPQPVENGQDAVVVVLGREVRHAVAVHDLRATKLQVGRVDLPTEHLVQRARAREDDRVAVVLDGPLAAMPRPAKPAPSKKKVESALSAPLEKSAQPPC